jgi:GGDEF domain-containing protein
VALETVEELVIFIELDNFKEIADKQGWVTYKPNEITGKMTEVISDFVKKYLGEVIYGLDERHGTTECMIRLTGALSHEEITQDLEDIIFFIEDVGQKNKCNSTVSIGVARGPYTRIRPTGPYQWSKRLFKGQAQRLARKALMKAKKLGGNRIIYM